MNKTEIKSKVKELESQIASLNKDLSDLFESELISLMKTRDVIRVEMSINNHEFNDGDATSFDLYYHDLSISFKDGRERESYGDENKDLEPLRKELVNFFSEFQSIFESKFGGESESINFTVKGNKLTW